MATAKAKGKQNKADKKSATRERLRPALPHIESDIVDNGNAGGGNSVPVGDYDPSPAGGNNVPVGDFNPGGGNTVPVGIFAPQVQVDGDGPAFSVKERNPRLSRRSVEWYGWRRDMLDPRDHIYAAPTVLRLPPKFGLNPRLLPPVYNQGKLGSCSGNAIAAALQIERTRQGLRRANDTPSRLFIYYNERDMEGTVDSDSGAQIRDGIKSVASQGDCFESGPDSWPYEIADFRDEPPKSCYAAALKDRVLSYSRLIQTIDNMKICLASGYPFIFGFVVFSSFESPEVSKTGVVPMPSVGDRPVGGHAVLAVGYDDEAQSFRVRNSWGADWGQDGYFTMPYNYLAHPSLASDFWTIRLIV
jgi:hypothetical protein